MPALQYPHPVNGQTQNQHSQNQGNPELARIESFEHLRLFLFDHFYLPGITLR